MRAEPESTSGHLLLLNPGDQCVGVPRWFDRLRGGEDPPGFHAVLARAYVRHTGVCVRRRPAETATRGLQSAQPPEQPGAAGLVSARRRTCTRDPVHRSPCRDRLERSAPTASWWSPCRLHDANV